MRSTLCIMVLTIALGCLGEQVGAQSCDACRIAHRHCHCDDRGLLDAADRWLQAIELRTRHNVLRAQRDASQLTALMRRWTGTPRCDCGRPGCGSESVGCCDSWPGQGGMVGPGFQRGHAGESAVGRYDLRPSGPVGVPQFPTVQGGRA
ncbi:MAG: hypothetical protein KatS3mg111_2053 [Pirellulaceae bacterium]|nr:MAG: hypothetical protein KatS3mg111_2053 [Pirellulaceae bacterium]